MRAPALAAAVSALAGLAVPFLGPSPAAAQDAGAATPPTTAGAAAPSDNPSQGASAGTGGAPVPAPGEPSSTVSIEEFQALQKQVYDLQHPTTTPPVTPAYGKLSLDGNLQFWFGAFTHPESTYYKLNGFGGRLRRMEVALNGVVDPKLSYHFMGDFSRAASTQPGTIGILQDIYVQYSPSTGNDVLLGQLKLPLTETGSASSAHLPTIERPLFVVGPRNASSKLAGVTAFSVPQWGDIRDIGAQYRYTQKVITAQVAITEGAGDYQNSTDNKYGKQVTGQVFFRPFGTSELQLGLTGSFGAGFHAQLPKPAAGPQPGAVALMRNRGGGSVVLNHGPWYAEGEYMGGVDGVGIVTATNAAVNVGRHGEYGIVGYDLGGYRKGDGNQVVVMEDYWDPGAGLSRQTNTVVGLNHDMDKSHARVQLNYVHEHYAGGLAPPASSDSDGLIAAFLVNW